MNQFRSPNEEIIDPLKEIWGCDSKESISNTEKSLEEACDLAFNGQRYEVRLHWRHEIKEPHFDSKYSLWHKSFISL